VRTLETHTRERTLALLYTAPDQLSEYSTLDEFVTRLRMSGLLWRRRSARPAERAERAGTATTEPARSARAKNVAATMFAKGGEGERSRSRSEEGCRTERIESLRRERGAVLAFIPIGRSTPTRMRTAAADEASVMENEETVASPQVTSRDMRSGAGGRTSDKNSHAQARGSLSCAWCELSVAEPAQLTLSVCPAIWRCDSDVSHAPDVPRSRKQLNLPCRIAER
jgi:hypothetical protein